MTIQFRALTTFPKAATHWRRTASFGKQVTDAHGWKQKTAVQLAEALDELTKEATYLGCRHLILEADFKPGEIRNDGAIKAGAKPASPRVVVNLTNSRHGQLRYPCDTFTRIEDNILAVARALEALRLVDRYGVTSSGEQYTGWKAIPSTSSAVDTADSAARQLVFAAGVEWYGTEPVDGVDPFLDAVGDVLGSAQCAATVIRAALKKAHPDTGGSPEHFVRVMKAKQVIEAHHHKATG